jgi:hypothetical protein
MERERGPIQARATMSDITIRIIGALVFAGVLAVVGCSDNAGPTGGPVSGATDHHCVAPDGGVIAQVTDLSTCHLSADAGQTVYGATQYNSEGDDDDCKYHVKFTNTAIHRNQNVTFTVTANTLADGQPATGADVLGEVFLSDTHPAPNSGQATTEKAGGVYDVGPILFDAQGRWTVRFHLHEDCQDATDDSPHGHIAFYIDVP